MSDEELINRYISLYESVNIVECFGSRDVTELYVVEGELLKRGYEFREQVPEVVKAE